MTVLNWTYGAFAPTEGVGSVEKQIRLAHEYKNKLIEIERERRLRSQAYACSLHPEFAAACVVVAEAEAAKEAAYEPLLLARKKTRKRVEATPEQDQRIKEAKAALQAAQKARKPLAKAAYALVSAKAAECETQAKVECVRPWDVESEDWLEAEGTWKNRINERKRELMLERGVSGGEVEAYRAELAARHDFVEQGLFWHTYSQVEQALAEKRKGPPPKFRRFDGNGTISVALRKEKLENILNGKSRHLKLVLPPLTERMATKGKDHGKQCRGTAYIRIGTVPGKSTPIWCSFPFSYHRLIPADAVIKQAHLDRRTIGTRVNWQFRLTLETSQASQPANNGELVVVHFGHRQVPEGLRVATAMNSAGEVVEELIISRANMGRFEYPRELISTRAEVSNDVLDEFEAWTKTFTFNDHWAEQLKTLNKWRGPYRLNAFVRAWPQHRLAVDQQSSTVMPLTLAWARAKLAHYQTRPNYRPKRPADLSTVFGLMQFWLDFDDHMWDWIDHQAAGVRRTRNSQFRNFASRLAKVYGRLGIAQIDWAKLREAEEEDVFQIKFTKEHRRLAGIASPGRCSQLAVERFREHVTLVSAKNITVTCHVCGHKEEFDHAQLTHTCSQCKTTWDQDVNAARNSLKLVKLGLETGEGVKVKTVKKKKLPRRNKPLTDPPTGPAAEQ